MCIQYLTPDIAYAARIFVKDRVDHNVAHALKVHGIVNVVVFVVVEFGEVVHEITHLFYAL